MSFGSGLAISTRDSIFPTSGPCTSFSRRLRNKAIEAVVFVIYAGNFSISGTVPIRCWSGSGSLTLIFTAGMSLQFAASDRSLICGPIICIPQCRVSIQI